MFAMTGPVYRRCSFHCPVTVMCIQLVGGFRPNHRQLTSARVRPFLYVLNGTGTSDNSKTPETSAFRMLAMVTSKAGTLVTSRVEVGAAERHVWTMPVQSMFGSMRLRVVVAIQFIDGRSLGLSARS